MPVSFTVGSCTVSASSWSRLLHVVWARLDVFQIECRDYTDQLGYLTGTSTCTVNLGSDELLMFGVKPLSVFQAYPYNTDGTPTAHFDALYETASVGEVILYEDEEVNHVVDEHGNEDMDAPDVIFYLRSFRDQTWGDVRFSVEDGSQPLKHTIIPASKDATGWRHPVVDYTNKDAPTVRAAGHTVGVTVTYKDPSIVHLPNGNGWLMFLARIQTISSVTTGGGTYTVTAPGTTDVEKGLSDIVAYWTDEEHPEFDTPWDGTRGVKGPFWIVSNVGTLGSGTDGILFWLGVPGGVMIDEENIVVHFVVEACRYAPTYSGATELVMIKAANVDAVFQNIPHFDRTEATTFVSCIGTVQFNINEIVNNPNKSYGNEAEWLSDPGVYLITDPGNLLYPDSLRQQRVYYWYVDDEGNLTEIVNYKAYQQEGDEGSRSNQRLKICDPQFCQPDPQGGIDVDDIRLFISPTGRTEDPDVPNVWLDFWYNAQTSGAPVLPGIWKARQMKESDASSELPRIDGSSSWPEVGFDFMLVGTRPIVKDFFYDETDASGVRYNYQPSDPDPVYLTTRYDTPRIRVMHGKMDTSVTEEPYLPMRGFEVNP